MEFISLAEALDCMAASAFVDGADMALIYSSAAAELHQKLHNSSQCPKWVEISKETEFPLFNDAVADDGMSILMHMAGWKRRMDEERNNHIFACLSCGLDPADVPQSMDINGGQYNWRKHYFLRETHIGFDRTEFMAFLGANESAQQETPAQRRGRIQGYVNNNFAKGISKTKSFQELAAIERCSLDNIRRIYYVKG